MTPLHDDLPTLDQLQCLVTCPKGTLGEENDRRLVATVLGLCREHGVGRVHQIAEIVEDLWRDPDKLPAYQAVQRQHWAQMGWGEP